MTNIEAKKIENHCKQTGVVRTNCVDCLGKNASSCLKKIGSVYAKKPVKLYFCLFSEAKKAKI